MTVSFADLGLSAPVLNALADAGYANPTPIQQAAIPFALEGRDVLGIAQTGTGKTASFTLPVIERLAQGRARARMPRCLVITPTRELAAQIAENFTKYAKYQKLSMALLIGGVAFGDQDRLLTQGVDVLIATPGRLLDHFERGKLLLTGVQIMVIDEADRMLDMGFIPDIERIFTLTPPTRQTLFFSATMPAEIQRLTQQFLNFPEKIEVARQATTAETIQQFIVRSPSSDPKTKRAVLRAAIRHANVKNGIVFCNRKTEVDIVAKSLTQHGFNAAPIHGDLDQSVRTKTLDRFRAGELTLLVASDVAARGLDIPDVGHVFNFDAPRHPEDYVHRIGRTGRAGRSGQAFMIIGPADDKALAAITGLIGKAIPDALIPDTPTERVADPRSAGSSRDGARRSGRSQSRQEAPRRAARDGAAPAPAPVDPSPASFVERAGKSPRRQPGARHPYAEAPGFGHEPPAFMLRSAYLNRPQGGAVLDEDETDLADQDDDGPAQDFADAA